MDIKKRDSNFEILRIISMIFIITSHYVIHNNLIDNSLGVRGILSKGISILANIGVNCFILISGYFLSKTEFNLCSYIKKIKKIILQVWIYSFGIFLVFTMFSDKKVTIGETLKSVFPILFSQYWFATTYIVMYILYPFLNIFIKNVSKDMYKLLLILLFIILSVIPTILPVTFIGNDITWFLFLYLVSSYIQKYKGSFNTLLNKSKSIFAITYIFVFLSTIFISYLSFKYIELESQIRYFTFRNRIPIFICSLALFLYFLNITMGEKKYINTISATTFGIYLIHDNLFIRKYIWNDVFNVKYYWKSIYMPIHIILSISFVFIICMLVELIRQKIFSCIGIKQKK